MTKKEAKQFFLKNSKKEIAQDKRRIHISIFHPHHSSEKRNNMLTFIPSSKRHFKSHQYSNDSWSGVVGEEWVVPHLTLLCTWYGVGVIVEPPSRATCRGNSNLAQLSLDHHHHLERNTDRIIKAAQSIQKRFGSLLQPSRPASPSSINMDSRSGNHTAATVAGRGWVMGSCFMDYQPSHIWQ